MTEVLDEPSTQDDSTRQVDDEITTDESFEGSSTPSVIDDREGVDGTSRLHWLMAAGIGLLVAGGIVAFFTVEVCDEELSNGGTAVKVCRHLEASDPPAIAVGVLLLAMLSVFFTEISGFGVTLKRDVARLKKASKATRAAVASNREAAHEASQHAADVGREMIALRRDSGDSSDVAAEATPARPDPIRVLADEYNELRLTMPSGSERTAAMTRVVTSLVAALRDVHDFDVPGHLASDDRGLRLAGYAYLYAYPDPRWSAALAESVIDREDKPFGQYWGLRALRSQCEKSRSAIDANTRRRLENELRPKLPFGTDRAVELAAVLKACAGG